MMASAEQRKPIELDDINAMDKIGPMLTELANFLSPDLITRLAQASYSTPTISSEDQYFQVGVAAYLPEALEPAANFFERYHLHLQGANHLYKYMNIGINSKYISLLIY